MTYCQIEISRKWRKTEAGRKSAKKQRQRNSGTLLRWASHRVLKAVRAGVLIPASKLMCVDCSKPAKVYDHRDYKKPFKIEPVCISCNKLRGPGKNWNIKVKEFLPRGKRNYPKNFSIPRQMIIQI